MPAELGDAVDAIAAQGGTPLVVAEAGARGLPPPSAALGVIYLKDIVKPGIAERFADLRRMGIRTVMITGDNPRTAGGHRGGSGRRRLPRRSHARGQDGAHPAASRRAAAWSR